MPSFEIAFTSLISASSLGKIDADKTTLITETANNNYLAKKDNKLSSFQHKQVCNKYKVVLTIKKQRDMMVQKLFGLREMPKNTVAIFLFSAILKLRTVRFYTLFNALRTIFSAF